MISIDRGAEGACDGERSVEGVEVGQVEGEGRRKGGREGLYVWCVVCW
jgi:hypothetical protein